MRLSSVIAFTLGCTLSAQPIPDFPKTIKIASGKVIEILIVRRSTLHKTDESCLVVSYISQAPLSDWRPVYAEAEQVWNVFRVLAAKEKVQAAVVNANAPPQRFLQTSRGMSWVWKRGKDGNWYPPADGDLGLVPK